MFEGCLETKAGTSELVGASTKFPRKTLKEFLLVPFCALFGGRFGAKKGTSEKRALAIRLLTKQDAAGAISNI